MPRRPPLAVPQGRSPPGEAPWREERRPRTGIVLTSPLELLANLAALTPRPAVNLLLYHGLLAPHARGRDQVVRYGRPAPTAAVEEPPEPPPSPRRNWTWAALMRRAFALDVLACPRCGDRMRLIATIADPRAVRQLLAAGPPGEPCGPGPPAQAA
jgi:hypothetical protein